MLYRNGPVWSSGNAPVSLNGRVRRGSTITLSGAPVPEQRPWPRLGHRHSGAVSLGVPAGSAGKESARNEGDPGPIPGLGRSPGGGGGYLLKCSGLENSIVRGGAESDTTG